MGLVGAAVIKSERRTHRAMLLLCVVCAVASMSGWLIVAVGGSFDALGAYTQICLALCGVLAVVNMAILCAVDCHEHSDRFKGEGTKDLTLWFDESEEEIELGEAEQMELIAAA